MKPQARKSGLLVRHIGEESVVYDLERHEAHCLNASAARVFASCDGHTTVGEMVAELRRALDADVDERWVSSGLSGLEKAHLLEPESSLPCSTTDRRDVLRRAGLGVVLLLPAVVSVVAPTPADAATCVPEGSCAGNEGSPCYREPPVDPEGDCALPCTCIVGICNCSGS